MMVGGEGVREALVTLLVGGDSGETGSLEAEVLTIWDQLAPGGGAEVCGGGWTGDWLEVWTRGF